MIIIKFYKNFIHSFKDLDGYNSLIIHSLVGCNFKCYGCHNYQELILTKHKEWYTEQDVINFIKKDGFLFDAIIFSGGEFLLENIEDIKNLLVKIKEDFNGIIIINTNGSFPSKIKELIDTNLINGVHLDIKYNYFEINTKKDEKLFNKVLGINYNQKIIDKLINSIEIVVKDNSPYSELRTVKYPILNESIYKNIENEIKKINKKFNSNINYSVNKFINIGDDFI